MYIKLDHLKNAQKKNVIRLANYVGVVSFNRNIDEIIEELNFKLNYDYV